MLLQALLIFTFPRESLQLFTRLAFDIVKWAIQNVAKPYRLHLHLTHPDVAWLFQRHTYCNTSHVRPQLPSQAFFLIQIISRYRIHVITRCKQNLGSSNALTMQQQNLFNQSSFLVNTHILQMQGPQSESPAFCKHFMDSKPRQR